MNGLLLPWTEITIAIPLVGAMGLAVITNRVQAGRWCLGITLITLACSILPWLVLNQNLNEGVWYLSQGSERPLFEVDGLSAPMLPLVALLHALVILSAPQSKGSRSQFAFLLAGEAVYLATFACLEPWPLVVLLALGTLPPLADLIRRQESIRVYLLHMGLFVALLIIGVATIDDRVELSSALLMLAVMVRSGTAPAHLWVADLFERTSFGSALLFVAPLAGVYTAIRLILPVAPDWVLQGIGMASLITAIYAAGMATVQRNARRMLAYLFLSHSSAVMVGLELHTAVSLTGALCLWVSVALSLGGMGLTLRALEVRFGPLNLTRHSGLYGQSPSLAVCFLLTGLACVGFPGTLGFVASDLLADGAVGAAPFVGVGLVVAAAFNGIAVLRGYLLLFTGSRSEPTASLSITRSERFALLTLACLILGGGLLPQYGVSDRHIVTEKLLERRSQRFAEEVAPEHDPFDAVSKEPREQEQSVP